jgi:hypothetical protein
VNRLLPLIAIGTREWKWTRFNVPESRKCEPEFILVILNQPADKGQSIYLLLGCMNLPLTLNLLSKGFDML